jgi:hypothetical protein
MMRRHQAVTVMEAAMAGEMVAAAAAIDALSRETLLAVLKDRFHANMVRHQAIAWLAVEAKLDNSRHAIVVLAAMEASGGEPDVVGTDDGAIMFVDCAPESPAGRRSLCFDQAALDARKENKPAGSAMQMAAAMGATLLDERQYRALQQVGLFDRKTSSWIRTPDPIRKLGGALFCDRRYDTVFTYHNGAESYYAARGFRCCLAI